MADRRSMFFQALTGRAGADVSGGRGDLHSMLVAAFGTSKRDSSRPDTAAAAESLGVSQRTVQRWLAGEGRQRQQPREETMRRLTTRARQAATTKRGRERALRGSPALRRTAGGMRVTVTGEQGLQPGAGYARRRTVPFELDPDLAAGFVQAYIDAGDRGAERWLVDNVEQTYNLDRWWFGDIDRIDIDPPYGRK